MASLVRSPSEPPAPARPGNLLVNPGSLAHAIHPESETQWLEVCSLFPKSSPSSKHSGRHVACGLVECTLGFSGSWAPPFLKLVKIWTFGPAHRGGVTGISWGPGIGCFVFGGKAYSVTPSIPLDHPVTIRVDYNSLVLFGIFKEFRLQIIWRFTSDLLKEISEIQASKNI